MTGSTAPSDAALDASSRIRPLGWSQGHPDVACGLSVLFFPNREATPTRSSRSAWAGRIPICTSSSSAIATTASEISWRGIRSTRCTMPTAPFCAASRPRSGTASPTSMTSGMGGATSWSSRRSSRPPRASGTPGAPPAPGRVHREDCGGAGGYAELLEILKDPEHPDYEERLEWVGGAFDPEAFNIGWVNAALRALIPGAPK